MRKIKIIKYITALLVLFLVFSPPAWSNNKWEYNINSTDTPSMINEGKTSAVIDTTNNEVKLPKVNPGSVDFWPSGEADYLVKKDGKVVHYSWTGSDMKKNEILSVNTSNNPLAVMAPSPYPDVAVTDKNGTKHYSFTGSDMVENPALSAADLKGTMFVGAKDNSVVGLMDGKVRAYTNGSRDTSLEPDADLNNPIGISLYSDKNNIAILEPDRVRYFMDTGGDMVENPALEITGLNSPKAVSTADDKDVAVVEGDKVKHYSYDGSEFKYNSVLSVTSGLNSPDHVALRPGSKDKIVVDGNEARYYKFEGGSLQYDPDRSVTVSQLKQLGGYSPYAEIVSDTISLGSSISHMRVRAYHSLPEKTSVTWYLSNGNGFSPSWRVRNPSDGNARCEIYDGGSWTSIGDTQLATPDKNTEKLWVEFPAGSNINWKAKLSTDDMDVTPKITDKVVWEAGNPPDKPSMSLPDDCYVTTTPVIDWNFSDPDTGDTQGAYKIRIRKASDSSIIYESGIVNDDSTKFEIPTSESPTSPGPLWASGEYEYTIEIRTYDELGLPSKDWSQPEDFCIIGLERTRVSSLKAPGGDDEPKQGDKSTHVVIKEGMTESELPKTKAGGKVGILVDSIGPLDSLDAEFPYLSKTASVGKIKNYSPAGSETNRWLIEFWTEASLEEVPDGTLVDMELIGHAPQGDTSIKTTGSDPYAAGAVKTEGSVYENWKVLLKESNK